jgi:hypothetical protein
MILVSQLKYVDKNFFTDKDLPESCAYAISTAPLAYSAAAAVDKDHPHLFNMYSADHKFWRDTGFRRSTLFEEINAAEGKMLEVSHTETASLPYNGHCLDITLEPLLITAGTSVDGKNQYDCHVEFPEEARELIKSSGRFSVTRCDVLMHGCVLENPCDSMEDLVIRPARVTELPFSSPGRYSFDPEDVSLRTGFVERVRVEGKGRYRLIISNPGVVRLMLGSDCVISDTDQNPHNISSSLHEMRPVFHGDRDSFNEFMRLYEKISAGMYFENDHKD